MKKVKQPTFFSSIGIIMGFITFSPNLKGMEEIVEKTVQLHHIKADDLPKLLTKETQITLAPSPTSNSIKIIGPKAEVDKVSKFIMTHLDVSTELASPMHVYELKNLPESVKEKEHTKEDSSQHADYIITFANGLKAVFKPESKQQLPKEVAAYKK